MRAGKYFATRMATSERVQHRLQEISRELSLQKVTGDHDDDDNSLVSQESCNENHPNKPPYCTSSGSVVSSATAHSSFSKRSNNSVQVVNMTILGARETDDDDDDKGAAQVDIPKRGPLGTRKQSSRSDRAAPWPEPSPTMSSSLVRPRLPSTTSLRSLSSSHQSSTSSSSTTANKSLTAKQIFRRPSSPLAASIAVKEDHKSWSRRLERGFYLLPTALSMTIMFLATVTALLRTLFMDAWTPLTFFTLMALYTAGGTVIHYNQVFWRKRLLQDATPKAALDASSSKLSARPQMVRRQSSRRGGRRPGVQRQASSASMASVKSTAGNSILSSTTATAAAGKGKKKSSSPWKFWKWQAKRTKLKLT